MSSQFRDDEGTNTSSSARPSIPRSEPGRKAMVHAKWMLTSLLPLFLIQGPFDSRMPIMIAKKVFAIVCLIFVQNQCDYAWLRFVALVASPVLDSTCLLC